MVRNVFQHASWKYFWGICFAFWRPNGGPLETLEDNFLGDFLHICLEVNFRVTLGSISGGAGGRRVHNMQKLICYPVTLGSPAGCGESLGFTPTAGPLVKKSCWNCSNCRGLDQLIGCLLGRVIFRTLKFVLIQL